MQQKKKGVKPIYEASLKIAVARDYLSSNLSSGELDDVDLNSFSE